MFKEERKYPIWKGLLGWTPSIALANAVTMAHVYLEGPVDLWQQFLGMETLRRAKMVCFSNEPTTNSIQSPSKAS